MRFSTSWDVLLLKAVCGVDAHVPPYGQTQARFEEALAIFIGSVPEEGLLNVFPPTWKTLNDRFKKVVADHRVAVTQNAVASGIIEVRGEREVLLDDIILEMDEAEEKRRSERDERTELDERLRAAGEDMRVRALSRKDSSEDAIDVDEIGAEGKGRKRRAVMLESDEEEKGMIEEHVKSRRILDEQRMQLEKDRLAFEQTRAEREDERVMAQNANDAKRLLVDERRIDLEMERNAMDREERRGAMEERKGMLAVLSALAEKLQ